MIVEEDGKLYNIDEQTGLVTVAAESDVGLYDKQSLKEVGRGDRVEVEGKLGHVSVISNSVYGDVVRVRFDDGSYGEYARDDVIVSTVESPDFQSPIEEVKARFASYQEMPGITEEEIDSKAAEGRQLNLRAKALITDKKTSLTDQVDLDHIVLITGTDLLDLKESKELVRQAENESYLNSFNKYRLPDEIASGGAKMGASSDASWLETAMEDFELTDATDADLASRASEAVAYFDRAQLEDDAFLSDVTSFQEDYLGIENEPEKCAKFASYVQEARRERLAEPVKEEKVASAEEENLDDFDTTALFI